MSSAASEEQTIRDIFQLCIRRLSEIAYNFAFIYEMSDGSYSFREYVLTEEKSRIYFERRGWPLSLPGEVGKTIMIVRFGKFIGDLNPKNADMPPK